MSLWKLPTWDEIAEVVKMDRGMVIVTLANGKRREITELELKQIIEAHFR